MADEDRYRAGVGARLRAARTARGVTQEDLARRIGVQALAVSRAERGRSLLRAHVLSAAARELGVPLDELVSGELDVPSHQAGG